MSLPHTTPLTQPAPERVLLLRALVLGDMLCFIPAARALRHAWPRAEITLVSLPWARELVQRFPRYFDDFIEFPGHPAFPEQPFHAERLEPFLHNVRRREFDLAVQFHGSGSHVNAMLSQFHAREIAGYYLDPADQLHPATFMRYPSDVHEIHRHLRLAEFLGARSQGDSLEWPVGTADQEALAAVPEWQQRTRASYICIHPGAQYPSRRWLPDRFAAVADTLAQQGFDVVLTGATNESELVADVARRMIRPHINLAGKTTLGMLGALLQQARLLISNDTGVAHLAAALRVPSVVIVTGSNSERWAPLNTELHRVVSAPAACRPCEFRTCPIDFYCAKGVQVRNVMHKAYEVLHATRHSVILTHATSLPLFSAPERTNSCVA